MMKLVACLAISTASSAGEKYFNVVAISVSDETAVLTDLTPDQQFTVVELGNVVPTTSFVLTEILPDRLVLQAKETVSTAPDETTSTCLLYTSPSPRDQRGSRMPSSA